MRTHLDFDGNAIDGDAVGGSGDKPKVLVLDQPKGDHLGLVGLLVELNGFILVLLPVRRGLVPTERLAKTEFLLGEGKFGLERVLAEDRRGLGRGHIGLADLVPLGRPLRDAVLLGK